MQNVERGSGREGFLKVLGLERWRGVSHRGGCARAQGLRRAGPGFTPLTREAAVLSGEGGFY